MVLVNGIVLIVGGGAVTNYSTEEQIIGTWIDGKPLYQRTHTGSVPIISNVGEAIKLFDLGGLFEVQSLDGYLVQSNTKNRIPINSYFTYTDLSCMVFAVYASNDPYTIYLKTNTTSLSSIPYVITLQYTKTTD